LPIEFQNDELYEACKAVEPFLRELVLVGGWAFRVHMKIVRDEDRYTKDVDFSVQLVSNKVFDQIKNHLLKKGFKQRKLPDRLKKIKTLQYSFEQHDKRIEILPFGESALHITDLNLKEYRLAFEDNEELTVKNTANDTLSLRIVRIPSLIVMKIFSLSDRWHERRKDLLDIDHISENYGSDNDKYGLTVKQKEDLDEEHVEYELAASHLLGREIQSRLDDDLFIEARDRLIKIIAWIRSAETNESARSKRLKILLEYFQDKYEPHI